MGTSINVVRVNNVNITKNLMYATEGGGLKYICGHDGVIENNIINSNIENYNNRLCGIIELNLNTVD
jgi:hypothetical protein